MRTYRVIAGVIKNEEDKLLMLDHIKTGLWTIPVGKVESGETLYQGLVREMKEEVNIDVVHCHEVAQYQFNFMQGITDTYIYNITSYIGEIINMEPMKHLNLKWMTISEIERIDVTDATQIALNALKEIELTSKQTPSAKTNRGGDRMIIAKGTVMKEIYDFLGKEAQLTIDESRQKAFFEIQKILRSTIKGGLVKEGLPYYDLTQQKANDFMGKLKESIKKANKSRFASFSQRSVLEMNQEAFNKFFANNETPKTLDEFIKLSFTYVI